MPRRARVVKREIAPDGRYGSKIIARFINNLMVAGKKSIAERIVYDALERAENQLRRPPVDIFEQALRNSTPVLEVKPRRVGGATYQVPVEIKGERRVSLAMRWLISSARSDLSVKVRRAPKFRERNCSEELLTMCDEH